MSSKSKQIGLIVLSLIICVLLFIANKQSPKIKEQKAEKPLLSKAEMSEVLSSYIDSINKILPPGEVAQLKLANANGIDSVIRFWLKQNQPEIAAQFWIEKARKTEKAEDWMKAGERNFYAVPFAKVQNVAFALYQQANFCFSKVLEKEPNNAAAKIKLAACLVEASDNPMQGINLLREVEKVDSNNIDLQLNFAFFSVKSKQFDRAIQRFEKVIAIDSNYVQAYLHLADVYEQMGNKEKTIKSLETYIAKINDPVAKQEIKKYINQLTNK